MNITTQTMPGCELVVVSGVLDSATAPALEKKLQDLLSAGRTRFVVDLAGVEFLSSVGIKALLGTVLAARRQSPPGDLVIAAARPEVMDLFRRVGLTHVFRFYDDVPQAVAAMT